MDQKCSNELLIMLQNTVPFSGALLLLQSRESELQGLFGSPMFLPLTLAPAPSSSNSTLSNQYWVSGFSLARILGWRQSDLAEKDTVETTTGDRGDDTTRCGGECFCTMNKFAMKEA